MLPAPLMTLARHSRGALRRLRGEVQRAGRTLSLDAETRRITAAFDREYYLAANPDVAASGLDPVSHFLSHGWREGRNPTADFSVRDYCELYPEVAAGGENPFAHYLRTGRVEGRVAKHDLGFRHDIIAGLEPLETRLAQAARRWEKRKPTPIAKLTETLATSRSGLRDLHLSVSHDNFSVNVGGLQLCVQREAQALASRGVDHLHLFPSDIYPVVRDGPGGLIGVLWNGVVAGYFPADLLATALAGALPAAGGRRSFALHSLLGHSVGDILGVLKALGLTHGFFWLHDFASVCAGFHLMRNDVADCAAPPADSAACTVCLYGGARARHVAEHRRLFEALSLTVVAPSPSALATWTHGVDLPHAREVILPHAVLGAPHPLPPPQPGPLKVAFVGVPTPHKGWPVFHDLAARFHDDPRYDFVQLGRKGAAHLPIGFHEVTVSADNPAAMRQALDALAVDVAVIWPICAETFSFTAYEAVAAGCAILTNPDSGNVRAFVAEGGHGKVLSDEAALFDLFETGAVLELARTARNPARLDLDFSALTAELRG